MKKIAIMLSTGFEEVEFSMPFDLWKRAGFSIDIVKIPARDDLAQDKMVQGSRGLWVQADLCWYEWKRISQTNIPTAIFLPGGMPGSQNLAEHSELVAYLQDYYKKACQSISHYIVSICAAPAIVLGKACGLLDQHKYSCYPGMEEQLAEHIRAQRQSDCPVFDPPILTADGVASAASLAACLISILKGREMACEVLEKTLFAPTAIANMVQPAVTTRLTEA